MTELEPHRTVSHEEWIAARKELLIHEKELSRRRDALNLQRRQLPWERVEKQYVFESATGMQTLSELFDESSQLVVYHFMFDPDWDAGCLHCSFWADSFNPNVVHLRARDIRLVAISRAPYPKLAAYKQRMGWTFDWYSSFGTDFNFDYQVSFTPEEQGSEGFYNYRSTPHPSSEVVGVSVFYKDEQQDVFHTYSTYARGVDLLNAAYNYIDLTPKGRDEEGREPQYWVRRHDEYAE